MDYIDNKKLSLEKDRASKIFVTRGQPYEMFEGIRKRKTEGAKLTEEARTTFFKNAGQRLVRSGASGKYYWKLLNIVLNKSWIPLILSLLDNDLFLTEYKEKAQIFNDYFIRQCTTTDRLFSSA